MRTSVGTLNAALEQQRRLTGRILKELFVNRGYGGVTEVRGMKIDSPKLIEKTMTDTQKRKLKYGFVRRATIRDNYRILGTYAEISSDIF